MNSDFQWSDDLVEEFEIFYNKIPYAITGTNPIQKGIEMFKASKRKKEYEILSYRNPNIITDVEGGNIEKPNEYAVFKNYPIHSVKRISDNEVFTVGDEVYETITSNKQRWSIKEFSLKDARCFTCGVNIENIKKVKTPLFKIEDGVEVPYGSYIIMLDTKSWSYSYVRIVSDQPINERFKFFSTHEAAEEYTIMNKPCLSLNDIKFWLEKYFNFPNGVSISQLKPLAQSKITNP